MARRQFSLTDLENGVKDDTVESGIIAHFLKCARAREAYEIGILQQGIPPPISDRK